ncbi:MAG: dihydroorotase [Myxococcota bacterium]|nr:dihydroorotase [Myxococcota bacterium]
MYDIIIRDGTIVRSTGRLVADIAIEGGKIAYVGGNPAGRAREEVSAIGRFVMPGVIDSHVQFCDPGAPQRESWATGSLEALRGGVTTVLDMPNSDEPAPNPGRVQAKLEKAATHAVVNYGVWASASADGIPAINNLWDSGLICGTKVFMGGSGGASGATADVLADVFQNTKGLLGIHAEDQPTLDAAHAQWKDHPSPVHNDVRPPEASVRAVNALIELVKDTGRGVHICHLSTAGELAALDPYRGDLPITSEVSPHHLFLSTDNAGELGNLAKVDPPIRTELDRRAMMAALKRGRLDTFGSYHSPHTLDEKSKDYWSTPSGLPGVGTMLPLILGALKHGRLSLELMVAMLSENPASIFGLEGKGVIEEGADADLVLFREGVTTKLTQEMVTSHCGWSPFVGREVGVAPDYVIVNGHIAARSGVVTDNIPLGKRVRYTGR